MPEGCWPTSTVSISAGGSASRSITYSLLSGAGFQAPPSCTQFIALVASASFSSGVIARLVGGPKIEFISCRLATIFGLPGSVPMSTIETISSPGAANTCLPASSQLTFWSLPTIMSSAPASRGRAISATAPHVQMPRMPCHRRPPSVPAGPHPRAPIVARRAVPGFAALCLLEPTMRGDPNLDNRFPGDRPRTTRVLTPAA